MSRTDFDIPWRLTDHTCSACGGRILAAVEDADHVRFADCGAEAGEGTR